MSNLQYRQSKIQEKRKQTPWRDFVMEICSWRSMMFYKNDGKISRYPSTDRKFPLLSYREYSNIYPEGQILRLENNQDSSFFIDYLELFYSTVQPSVIQYGNQNIGCDWADTIRNGGKNIYLTIVGGDNAENVLYSYKAESNIKDIFNSAIITNNSLIVYNSKAIRNSFKIFFSKYIYDSNNVWFSINLIGCSYCILCSDLVNQSYCINNKKFESKEEFFKQYEILLKEKHKFHDLREELTVQSITNNCIGSSGNGIFECRNTDNAYDSSRILNGKNILHTDGGGTSSELYDCHDVATENSHHLYAVHGQACGDHIYCCAYINGGSFLYYSFFIENCSFCLGCIGLKNKSYCILNKQYTKEERYKKVDEIFGQMEADGTLGEFFPATMNPFYFNDTAAYLIDPTFTKEEVVAKGYLWRDEPIKVDIPAGAEVVKTQDLHKYEGWMVGTDFHLSNSDNVQSEDVKNYVPTQEGKRHINPSILKKIIQDPQGNIYRIVPMEYEFLMKHGLPLPRKHWLDRMKENFKIS